MGSVIDLARWRTRDGPAEGRLERAVARLEELLQERGDQPAPAWLVTQVLAILGALSLGSEKEAAERAERLVALCEHPSSRRTAL